MTERTVAERAAIDLGAYLRRLAANADNHGWYEIASTLRKAHALAKQRMHPADRRQFGKT